jgi:hypothetical protein
MKYFTQNSEIKLNIWKRQYLGPKRGQFYLYFFSLLESHIIDDITFFGMHIFNYNSFIGVNSKNKLFISKKSVDIKVIGYLLAIS